MILSFFKKQHPKQKTVYAITGGKYLGEMFVFIEEKNQNTYGFLSLPEMHIRDIPKEKFEFGLKEKIIDVIDKIPSYVYNVCVAQYKKNSSISTPHLK
jgi:hypothetical protein